MTLHPPSLKRTKTCSQMTQLIHQSLLRRTRETRSSIPTLRGLLQAALRRTWRRQAVKRQYGICRYFPNVTSTRWKKESPSLKVVLLIYWFVRKSIIMLHLHYTACRTPICKRFEDDYLKINVRKLWFRH